MSVGGHDYLSMIARLLDAEEFSAGKAIEFIDVQVNFKPYDHVVQMYDEKTNSSKENADYLFQRRKKTLKVIYLSMVSTFEEEEKVFRRSPLDAEKFNEFCLEFRKYLDGIERVLEEKDDFNLKAFLEFVDERFSILPLSDSSLNEMLELHRSEKKKSAEDFKQQRESGLIGDAVKIEHPEYWDTSVLDKPASDDASSIPIDKVTWSYEEGTFEDFDEFVKELTLYNWECTDYDGQIKDFELTKSNRVKVRFWGLPEGAERCSDIEVVVEGPNKNLSYLEFMHIANNKLHKYLCEIDHIFYEGYEFLDDADGMPVIQIRQGS